MSRFDDMRGALEEQIAREQAALGFIGRLERFVTALEDRGYGVDADVCALSGAELRVNLQVFCPAGVVSVGGVDLVEAAPLAASAAAAVPSGINPDQKAPLGPLENVPDVLAGVENVSEDARIVEMRQAGESLDKIAAACKRSKSFIHERVTGPLMAEIAAGCAHPRHNLPYEDAEDAQIVALAAAGANAAAIAKAVGRTKDALVYRCKNFLAERIAAARAGGGPAVASVAEPEPEPEPVAEVASAPAVVPPESVPASAPAARPAISPIAGLSGDDVTDRQMQAHLAWFYGACPDPDVVASDLELVQLLLSTGSAQVVAEEFDWGKDQVVARFAALRADIPCTLRLQTRLIDALQAVTRGLAA